MSFERVVPIAPTLEELLGEDSVYHQLVEFERELDFRIIRKQTQIADAAFKVSKVKRTLKVYVSHYSENQPSFGIPPTVKVDNPPSWTLRIDARLEGYGRQGRTVTRPFSHFLKSLVVQLGDGTDPSQIIEWVKGPNVGETDGFEIKRTGAVDIPVRILLRLDHQPERFRLSHELGKVVDLELATKPQIVLAVWQYIKLHKLQESDEKKIVNNDECLQQLFECDKMSFSDIPAKLDPHLLPPEPIELDYYLAAERVEGSALWDIDVEVDDPSKPRPMSANLVAQQREIALLEQRIAEIGSALRVSAAHQRTLELFAADPVECMRRMMEAHCADQEVALGEPPITLDDISRSSNFDNDEVERAVAVYSASTHQEKGLFRP